MAHFGIIRTVCKRQNDSRRSHYPVVDTRKQLKSKATKRFHISHQNLCRSQWPKRVRKFLFRHFCSLARSPRLCRIYFAVFLFSAPYLWHKTPRTRLFSYFLTNAHKASAAEGSFRGLCPRILLQNEFSWIKNKSSKKKQREN